MKGIDSIEHLFSISVESEKKWTYEGKALVLKI